MVIHRNLVAMLLLVLASFGGAALAEASEVTGTLSSDGSSETGATLDEREASVVAQANPQSSGQLQGSVTGGRDNAAAAAAANLDATTVLAWTMPISLMAIAVLMYLVWRRGSASY